MGFGFLEAILSWLNSQVGKRTDAANAAGSLHAKAANITDKVNVIGTPSDTRASNTVMGWLQTNIKSIQRGITSLSAVGNGSAAKTVNIDIGAVDVSKAIVLISGSATTSYDSSANVFIRARLTSSTNLEIYHACYYNSSAAWQVIEFY